MTRIERLRRVALLCIHFTRNLAFSRAIDDLIPGKHEGDFWSGGMSMFLEVDPDLDTFTLDEVTGMKPVEHGQPLPFSFTVDHFPQA